ncbi:hypothetical protein GCM10007895_02500 [Paraferrimonas sedimenticola]|uniref:Uncharacterized protein n=1 Tax=Paraferrimonas sedimenticola TaxID=375674 RepID=A0AA37VSU9_9GAMM|nr:hypothetical protein GCM10007895_02500 [Paraferrimonas sedimenticola]
MNKIKLITFELSAVPAYSLKMLGAIAAAYIAFGVNEDLANQYILLRGTEYTVAEDPSMFYLNIIKRLSFIAFFLYLAIWGIRAKKAST